MILCVNPSANLSVIGDFNVHHKNWQFYSSRTDTPGELFVRKSMLKRSVIENYHSFSLHSIVSKTFENLVNNRLVNYLEKRSLFSNFQYGFRSSNSTEDLMLVVSDRTAKVLNRSWALSKAFLRIWSAGLLNKLKFC